MSADRYLWHVGLDDVMQLRVVVSGTAATTTHLSWQELDDRLPSALQRFAVGCLRNDLPVMDQVGGWDSPVVLRADHFE